MPVWYAQTSHVDLHWLPVQYRVTYKLATLTYSIKQSGQPSYLHQLLQDYQPTYSLRSALTTCLRLLVLDLLHLVHLDILQLPPGILYHLISAIVTLSLLLNVDWRHSSLIKPLPSTNRIPAPTNSSRYIWRVIKEVKNNFFARNKFYFTYLLTYLLYLFAGTPKLSLLLIYITQPQLPVFISVVEETIFDET